MLQYSGLKYYLIELSFYGGSALLYAVRPSRFSGVTHHLRGHKLTPSVVPPTRAPFTRHVRYLGSFASALPCCNFVCTVFPYDGTVAGFLGVS